MGKRTRKSTALVSLVLVPLNLMALGFTGCDSRDDKPDFSATTSDEAGDASATADFAAGDFEDPDDPFNLDPVPAGTDVRGPTTFPTTQPLGGSAFAALPPNPANHYRSTHYGPGILFLPIPFRTGYQPPYRPGYRSSQGTSVFRSSPGRSSSSISHSSGTSRGGFGSSAASHSASS
jgi:uncharacterized membrane protein YgcG